jgi:glycosyltransferase involved in cell wall biosynthesis
MQLLVICFFPAFTPPQSGGELRLLNLYRAVSTVHDVVLLTSTDFGARFEVVEHGPRFKEYRFPKDEHWRRAYDALGRAEVAGELSGLAFALAVNDPACALTRKARELAAAADYVVHEFPYSEPIFADGSCANEIYNSHNFEAALFGAIAHGRGVEIAVSKLLRLEGNLARRARRVFATSEDDAEKFRLFYGVAPAKLSICPNGFDEEELAAVVARRRDRSEAPRRRARLLFLGSAHAPNLVATALLLRLAPALPECDFVIAGGVAKAVDREKLPTNVSLVDSFDANQKRDLLSEADIFLNPIVQGSGTSLKAIEALAAGLPLVSTAEGVRGLQLTSSEAVVVSLQGFQHAIRSLLADDSKRERSSAAGLQWARRGYSWGQIAGAFVRSLSATAAESPPPRPLLLALNDYPVSKIASGGSARVINVLSNLDCDVVLATFGLAFEILRLRPGLIHIVVPKLPSHTRFEQSVNEGQTTTANDCVAALFAPFNQLLRETIALVAPRADAVVFEHCYMASTLDQLRALRPDLPIIYSAHNVEARQKVALLGAHPFRERLVGLTEALEKSLVAEARWIVCCTEPDRLYFSNFSRETIVTPNGGLVSEHATGVSDGKGPARVGFIGSSHGPNVEAADFILRTLAPALPQVQFEFVGTIATAINAPRPANVTLFGPVSDEQKSEIAARWTLAINPLANGGGSSLKMADYMAHGLPTIATPIGGRGFPIVGEELGDIAEIEDFVAAVARALSDDDRLRRHGRNAYRYARSSLDWRVTTKAYRDKLRALLRPGAPLPHSDAERSLLVVTYRYTEPALGGAEEYLINVLKRLRLRFARLDLAAIDVVGLSNHYHFGARFEGENAGPATRIGALFDRALFFAPDTIPEADVRETSRDLERMWAHEEHALLLHFVPDLIGEGRARVFAGFFGPEQHDRIVRRWTSPMFSFFLPAGAAVMTLRGFTPIEKEIRVAVARPHAKDVSISEIRKVNGAFSLNLLLPEPSRRFPVILVVECGEHHAKDDHRPLGLLLESAAALVEETEPRSGQAGATKALEDQLIDIAEEHERRLRSTFPERWIDALRTVARQRADASERRFASIRGPHSQALQQWLAREGGRYDIVLVQGIPFDVVPSAVRALRDVTPRPRVVALPHFHGDDRFYYWRRYLDAFAECDATVMFSKTVADRLSLEKLVVAPGGGVDPVEPIDETARARFREVHSSSNPFFLVLGRKTPSKNYRRILAAQETLRGLGRATPELVLIGPDEDGLTVAQTGAYYLGRQPREVILGALQGCVGVVTMSDSESFGIVVCEAWLFAKPVIANGNCLAFRELVRGEENGILVNSDAELADAMMRLSVNTQDAARMGEQGLRDVRERYLWDRVAENIFAVLVGP